MNKAIEERIPYWAEEFAREVGIEFKTEHEKTVRMALYTMLYEIADNFRNGEFREKILKQFAE